MTIKRCKDCGSTVYNDVPSGRFWCPHCKAVKDDYDTRLRIVVFGKNTGKDAGRNNFSNCMVRALERLGHEVIPLSQDYLYNIVPTYDFTNCFHDKKPINIKQMQYEHDPDFIYICQTYNRLNIDEVTCPVIYQHREYTHFPDVLNPAILLATYYWRLRPFEIYHPWEYCNIPYKDYLYCAADPEIFPPVEEKSIHGITHIGLAFPMWQFREANGMFGDMVMEDQEIFWEKCIKAGYVNEVRDGLNGREFAAMLGRCEALLYDAGRFGAISRRLFEAIASKTMLVIRVHSKLAEQLYKQIGLTDEMCYFVRTPEDVGKIAYTEEERKAKVDKAYEWYIANHTYDVRAKELIEKFEAFKQGEKKTFRFMGYALERKVKYEGSDVSIE